MTRKIIGIAGYAGAGKDTAAAYIYESSLTAEMEDRVFVQAFATNLKQACSAMFGIPFEEFSDPAVKNIPDSVWNLTPRQIAQFVGTELVRDNMEKLLPGVGKDFWVQSLDLSTKDADLLIIPDVRFQNEADWILENGGIIINLTKQGADGNVGIANHASEQGFSVCAEHAGKRYFHLTNNGTKEELYEALTPIVRQYLSQ